MTALNNNPQNVNLLQPTKFLLSFDRIKGVQYFCQTANLPSVSLGEVVRNTPVLDIYSAGNKLTYEPLTVTFIIDEALLSWKNIHDWFREIANPENLQTRKVKYNDYMSSATLTLLSALNNPTSGIQFFGLFPTSLTGVTFDTKSSAETIMTATATFRYEYYNILPA